MKGHQDSTIAKTQRCVYVRRHGIIVCNHGGRATRNRPVGPSRRCRSQGLAAGFQAVDGGVRRGTDVFRRSALGATRSASVAQDRSLSSFGQQGVDRVSDSERRIEAYRSGRTRSIEYLAALIDD